MSNSIRCNGVVPPEVTPEIPASQAGSPRAIKRDVAGAVADPSTQPISDLTNLSAVAGVLGAAAKTASSLSPIRAGLVARIKQQIASGTYRPNPNAVAARVALALRDRRSR
jgi:flagellar biosynthesis anti-sigma factor FlgM